MNNTKLQPCPFCGGDDIRMSGDHTVFCGCGASVTEYDYTENTTDRVVGMWNRRALNLNPLIHQVSKLEGQGSAYTDLCSANYKLSDKRK